MSLTSHRHARCKVAILIREWLLLPRWLELRLSILLEVHRLFHRRHGHTIVWLFHELIWSEILIVRLIVLEILSILHSLEIVLHVLVRRSKGPSLGESRIIWLESGLCGSEGRLKVFSNFHSTLFRKWVCWIAWWLNCGGVRDRHWWLLLDIRSYLSLDLLCDNWLSSLCRYWLYRRICSRGSHLCLRLG